MGPVAFSMEGNTPAGVCQRSSREADTRRHAGEKDNMHGPEKECGMRFLGHSRPVLHGPHRPEKMLRSSLLGNGTPCRPTCQASVPRGLRERGSRPYRGPFTVPGFEHIAALCTPPSPPNTRFDYLVSPSSAGPRQGFHLLNAFPSPEALPQLTSGILMCGFVRMNSPTWESSVKP